MVINEVLIIIIKPSLKSYDTLHVKHLKFGLSMKMAQKNLHLFIIRKYHFKSRKWNIFD